MSSSLLKTEWLKLKGYPAFWWMMGIIVLSYPGINWGFYHIYLNLQEDKNFGPIVKMLPNPFAFPEAWHTAAYLSSWFVFIPSIIVIMFITNEYTYKTHRQNVIDGWSRKQFMLAKMGDVFIITCLITILYAVMAFIVGSLNSGTGSGNMWSETKYIPLFFLQSFSQLSLAFLIAFLTRRAFVALGIFLFYYVVIENVIVGIGRAKWNDIGRFMPFEISDRLIPLPRFLIRDEAVWKNLMSEMNTHIFYTLILTVATWAICFWINNKRDL